MGFDERVDIAVVGAGAAGLFASIRAAQTLRERGVDGRVIALDGAKKLGAKILVAGGGRCNVTHYAVDESAYAGSSRNAIKKVLRRFGVAQTVEFFADRGVELKREETGKLFPTTDDAHTILDALLGAARDTGVTLVHPWRVDRIESTGGEFRIHPDPSSQHPASIRARRVILATGGMALPRTGSDGHGYALARSLGHTITAQVFPALVPLVLDPQRSFVRDLSGLTVNATVELWSGSGRKLQSFTNSILCTHFGLSGPGVLDISRYFTAARHDDPQARLSINWLPRCTFDQADAMLAESPRLSVGRRLAELLPDRLGRALCGAVTLDPSTMCSSLRRDDRRALAHAMTRCEMAIAGDRGFSHAEVTAGGIPLAELNLDTMESRACPGLYLCGEICDVDGRIGGFNFQWAWASGHIAGSAAAGAIADQAGLPPSG